MLRRNTKQKEIILGAVKELANHPSASEVYEHIHASYPNIGKSTVYRNLEILAEEGSLLKIGVVDGEVRYDHTLTKHSHVICIKCMRVFDVEVDGIGNLCRNIKNDDGIKFLDYDITFKGICKECQGKNK